MPRGAWGPAYVRDRMGVRYHDKKGPWDYSGKELSSSFKPGGLPTSFSWLTSRNLGLSENLRHLARQAKVGVVSSESGTQLTRLKVSNRFAPGTEPARQDYQSVEVTFLRPQCPVCLAYFWREVCGYEAPRRPPRRLPPSHRSARHDDPLDQSCHR